MSFVSKVFQGFLGLGGIGTIPFLAVNPFKKEVIKEEKDFVAPPHEDLEEKETNNLEPETPPPPIEELLVGYKSCTLLEGQRWKRVLYVCAKHGGIDKPSFFYYDKTRWNKSKSSLQKKPEQIKSMGYRSSSFVTMQFEDGKTETLKPAPFWMKNWRNEELKPEEHCQITKNENSSSFNTLTCKHTSRNELGKNEWVQYISAIL